MPTSPCRLALSAQMSQVGVPEVYERGPTTFQTHCLSPLCCCSGPGPVHAISYPRRAHTFLPLICSMCALSCRALSRLHFTNRWRDMHTSLYREGIGVSAGIVCIHRGRGKHIHGHTPLVCYILCRILAFLFLQVVTDCPSTTRLSTL
jgi:hypothetical protein